MTKKKESPHFDVRLISKRADMDVNFYNVPAARKARNAKRHKRASK